MIDIGNVLQERYLVTKKVGDGGMQAVYCAKDSLIDRFVAVKTPLPGQASRRFEGSAIIAAKVNHQNVAKTYDYFVEDDAAYLVEEFVAGFDLDTIYPLGRIMDLNSGVHTMLGLARGIAASHLAGVVHRDLKPSNVVCVKGGLLATSKITDFGIATFTDAFFAEEAQSGEITKSSSGTIKGAIPYMSPEMLFRKPGDHPGASSDIWSLGAMMFRLLTGLYPFDVGMMVPVNVKNGNRAPWPAFMRAKPQFEKLASEIQVIIESCLVEDPAARPAASMIVAKCEELCFSTTINKSGMVETLVGSSGRIRSSKGGLYHFHVDSVYADRPITIGDAVMFASYEGSPYHRAHPVCLLPENA